MGGSGQISTPGTRFVRFKQQLPGDLAVAEQLKLPVPSKAEGEQDKAQFRGNLG